MKLITDNCKRLIENKECNKEAIGYYCKDCAIDVYTHGFIDFEDIRKNIKKDMQKNWEKINERKK